MREINKIFYDGMESVKLVDGVIHMNFYNLINDGEKEEKVPAAELILNQQAFLRAYGAMDNLIGQLEKAGLIKRKTAENENTPSAVAPSSTPVSPNFQ